MRITRQTGWAGMATFFSVAVMAAGLSLVTAPAQAALELPEGERITNVPVVPRSIPKKEEYELYDPKSERISISRNSGYAAISACDRSCGTASASAAISSGDGACNNPNTGTTPNGTPGKPNDFYVQQWVRLGIGYDLSPDLNFYMELQDSRTWGGNGANGTGAPKTIRGTITGVRQRMAGATAAHWGSELPTCWSGT